MKMDEVAPKAAILKAAIEWQERSDDATKELLSLAAKKGYITAAPADGVQEMKNDQNGV